jgi:Phage capsid family
MTTMTTTDQPAAKSPGQMFAAACAQMGTTARVDFSATITDQFPGFKRRPRLAMRNLFKIVGTSDAEARYWLETRPADGTKAVRDEQLRPEAGLQFTFEASALRPTTAWVQVPPLLLEDPESLATFIDFRLLVRLGTAENQSLALGRGGEELRGLLKTPGIRRLPAAGDPISSLLFACDHVELMGGSADGIVMSTTDYYRYLFQRQDVLTGLANLGIRIVRTRMIAAGTAIVGDFYAGATIFDSERSSIAFERPPADVFARDSLAVRGEIRTALAVHLPTHFFVASLV